jgi:hypothetical protein
MLITLVRMQCVRSKKMDTMKLEHFSETKDDQMKGWAVSDTKGLLKL